MKQLIVILGITGILSVLVSSCKTDLDLNAPYDQIPIVYGILDPTVDTQYVKINRTYLAPDNNQLYASVNDSNLYTAVSAKVEEYLNGELITTFALEEEWAQNIEDGLFYSDSQKVFYFVTPGGLNEDATYKINIDITEESDPVIAETEMVYTSGLSFEDNYSQVVTWNNMSFARKSTLSDGTYIDETPKWITTKNGKRYELLMRFHYLEYTSTGVYTSKFIDWSLGSHVSTSTSGNQELFKKISGEAFYDMIKGKLSNYEYEADVTKRVVRNIELFVYAGNENLSTYIELSTPSDGLVKQKPIFTNIEGGYGLFASRTKTRLNSGLDDFSVYALWGSEKTKGLKFCSDSTNLIASISNKMNGANVGVPHP